MIQWSDIDTVLLDMDGTLLDLAFDNYFWLEFLPRRYAQVHNVPLGKARALLEARSDATFGSLEWYCLDHWSRDLDMDIPALKMETSELIRFRPHAREFLQFLDNSDKRIMLVTNAHPKALQIKAESSGLFLHIAHMVSTHEFGLAKENPGFWPKLATRENIDLGRSLLIDDSHRVLARARDEGVTHLLQILQPDTRHPADKPGAFPGIVHFSEIMIDDLQVMPT